MEKLLRLLFLTILLAYNCTETGYTAATGAVATQATSDISSKISGPSKAGKALNSLEEGLTTSALTGCGFAFAPLDCVFLSVAILAVSGTVHAAHALFGIGDFLRCELTCKDTDGAKGAAAFSWLIETWITQGRQNKQSDHDTLANLIQFIMAEKSQSKAMITATFGATPPVSLSTFLQQKNRMRKAIQCIKGCGTFATKNFMFSFLTNLKDPYNYGISIIASLLLDTTISWSVRIPSGDPKKSKLANFTKYDPKEMCTNSVCNANFNFLYDVAAAAADPKKIAIATNAALAIK